MGFIQKHMKGFLVVSVLVNILLIGMVGGHVYKKWSSHPWHEVKAQLSPESRNVVGRTFQSAFREGRPIADEARKARAEIVKVLSEDELDEEALDAAIRSMLDTREKITEIKIKAMKDVAGQLSAEDRRIMADRMARMVGGGHEKRVKRDRRPQMIKPDHKPAFGPREE